MTTTTAPAKPTTAKGITFYTAAEAPPLEDDGIMTPPEIDEAVTSSLDLAPLAAGCVSQPELIATACPYQPAEDQTMCLEGLVESFAAFEPDKAVASCSHLQGHAAEICQAA